MADEAEQEKPVNLGKYRGKPVASTVGKITNTGDGLQKPFELDPAIDEPGSFVTFVVRTRVGSHRYQIDDESKTYVLHQQYSAGIFVRIDDDLVADAINQMEARIQARADANEGRMTMPGTDATVTGRNAGKGRGKGKLAVVDGGRNDDSKIPAANDSDGYVDLGNSGDPKE